METFLWILAGLMTFPLAYQIQFTSVTLSLGKELAGTGSQKGFQDAITPPWQTNFGLMVYFVCAVIPGVMWWEQGFLSALGAAALIIIGSAVARLALPKPTDNHYKDLILRSMISRYANYVRDGDSLRAEAMGQLLVRAGVSLDEFKNS